MEKNKICKTCMKVKEYCFFYKNKNSKGGYERNCKECHIKYGNDYRKSKRGLIVQIYSKQVYSSKKRGHNLPTYTRKELKEWMYAHPKFHILYDNWKRLDFQKEYTPSVDRKDDYIGYTMKNIQIMTWGENKAKGHESRKSGKNNKQNKEITQIDARNKKVVGVYHSIHEAARKTGINRGNISSVCSGRHHTAGGFMWTAKPIKRDTSSLKETV